MIDKQYHGTYTTNKRERDNFLHPAARKSEKANEGELRTLFSSKNRHTFHSNEPITLLLEDLVKER